MELSIDVTVLNDEGDSFSFLLNIEADQDWDVDRTARQIAKKIEAAARAFHDAA